MPSELLYQKVSAKISLYTIAHRKDACFQMPDPFVSFTSPGAWRTTAALGADPLSPFGRTFWFLRYGGFITSETSARLENGQESRRKFFSPSLIHILHRHTTLIETGLPSSTQQCHTALEYRSCSSTSQCRPRFNITDCLLCLLITKLEVTRRLKKLPTMKERKTCNRNSFVRGCHVLYLTM